MKRRRVILTIELGTSAKLSDLRRVHSLSLWANSHYLLRADNEGDEYCDTILQVQANAVKP